MQRIPSHAECPPKERNANPLKQSLFSIIIAQHSRILDWLATLPFADAERIAFNALYDQLGIGDRTAIEFFNGGHTINGVGTFEFLHKYLDWPKPD